MSKRQNFYLEFKYIQNVMVDFGDGNNYAIPTEFKVIKTEAGHEAVVPQFNLNHIHRMALLDEEPRIPVKQAGMSERYHSELADGAFRVAASNKVENDKIRARVNHFAKKGVVEIIADPFAIETRDDSAEVDEPVKSAKQAAPVEPVIEVDAEGDVEPVKHPKTTKTK
jgi:hypothetical protein